MKLTTGDRAQLVGAACATAFLLGLALPTHDLPDPQPAPVIHVLEDSQGRLVLREVRP